MSIKLKWVDRNVTVDGFRIYRSTSPIDDAALPTPLATVGPSVFEYTDTTAQRNVLYYYKIGSYLGSDQVNSPNRPLAFLPYTGPGPQTLLRGDYKAGFFGEVPLDDIIGVDDFKTFYGLTWGLASVRPTAWLKFVVDGKILFWPDNGGFFVNISATQIYQAGLMYGTNDDTLYWPTLKSGSGTINQVRPYTKGDHVFVPRMPIARVDRRDTSNLTLAGGELDIAFGMAYTNRTNLATYPGAMSDYLHNTGMYFFTQDCYTGNLGLLRGAGQFDSASGSGLTGSNGSYSYRPVLELQF
ncbi:putative virion structural protein [Pseudomonas phage Noxifer]|uniref:Putative virion structural protein n=1 Tax=Pseudomonas phage Noxifer TaxID=2006684 RepID=A0A1Y0SUW4_9CAUD|nr:putative virion structural protein [Pseudomonas phage Noxifer]ARV77302.1 putative virion structural protein [Pseudomonas phage Noxifer]